MGDRMPHRKDVSIGQSRVNMCRYGVCLVVALLTPWVFVYGSEIQQDENIATDSAQEKSQRADEHNARDIRKPLEEVDDDTAAVDVDNSIDIAVDNKGWFLRADLRGGFFASDVDLRDGSSLSLDELRLRARLEADIAIQDTLRFKTRVAGVCSTEGCDLDANLRSTIPTTTSTVDGEFTVDEAFLHHFRPRYDIAIGRLQTKFVARGGVFAKSLDRNDSNNVRINWTDGLPRANTRATAPAFWAGAAEYGGRFR